ncbi:FadR/GntR family transcriptional regulator [Shimia biformata]|uniref:FadR/GntR family transcriptional regulator n=1 Tax=Shimia biformata TaxID=1294299 RepID=UPI00194E7D58|nr:FadR/GntR family transcriptional regulator [Shimia biformata]
MTDFPDIRREGYLPDRIAAEIMAQVDDGRLKPGDYLPTETQLADAFGVSRNVVREAIARLRADGVIKSKQGKGACILPPSERATFRIDPVQLNEAGNLSDLFELRRTLEVEAAGLAAERRSKGDLERMRVAMEQMEGTGSYDDARIEADAAFHRAIGAASRNTYLAAIVDYISGRVKETTRQTGQVYQGDDLLDVSLSEHSTIFAAIEQGDASGARAAMAQHVAEAARRLGLTLNASP